LNNTFYEKPDVSVNNDLNKIIYRNILLPLYPASINYSGCMEARLAGEVRLTRSLLQID